MANYKTLFEGKFTRTVSENNGFLENLYYNFSSSTYGDKVSFKLINKYLKNKESLRILDVGCGGGHKSLLKLGQVYGIDVSKASIDNAKKIYFEAKVCDFSKGIPYEDEFFDFIFCFEVIGHIDYKDKDFILSEIKRVLKKDGVCLFSIETYGKNLITEFLKKKELYQKLWIDFQGHIGLETPKDTILRLNKFFTIVKVFPTSNHLMPIDGYLNFKDDFKFLKFFENNLLRRILNILIFPTYYLSLKIFKVESANDLIFLIKNKS